MRESAEPKQPIEEWAFIKGTNDRYLISNYGKVISLCKGKKTLTITTQKTGYKYVMLDVNGKPTNCRLHRLVAMAFVPNPNGYTEVNHLDGNKDNNRFDNLQWCNRSINMRHYYRVLGNPGHKLTEETKRKLSEANKGKHLSEETKRKIAESNRGKHPSEETKRKLSECSRGRRHTEETKRKISEANRGRHHTEGTKAKTSHSLMRRYQLERARRGATQTPTIVQN